MSLFDKIVKNKTGWKIGIDPLWKLQLSDDEYEELKTFLHDNIIGTYQPYCIREAALYFGEWWKREYTGGPHKKVDVAATIGLSAYSEDLYLLAVRGAESLRIKFIRMETTRYLDTLLLQGGLPLKALSQNDGVNIYDRYLRTIIRYVSSHFLNNWENIDFIKGFNNYISPSFHNDVMNELTLAIVRAIHYDDDSFFPFNINDKQFENLVYSLKKTKSESKRFLRENPFSVNWFFDKSDENLSLSYKIECQSIISENWVNRNLHHIGDPFSRLSLVIEDSDSQKYIRKNNGEYAASFSGYEIKGNIKDFDRSVISGQINTNTNQIFDLSVPNSDIPDVQYPLIASKIEENGKYSKWKIVNNPIEGNQNVAVCTEDWHCNGIKYERLKINGINVLWFEFEKEIVLISESETLHFDSNYSLEYQVDFGLPVIDWIIKSNFFPISTNPRIRVFDFEENHINSKKYKVHFRLKGDNDWLEYRYEDALPIGLIEFKVLIENRVTIRKQFFNCGSINQEILNSTSSCGELIINWSDGIVTPLNEQNGLEVNRTGDNRWRVSYEGDFKDYPDVLKFELNSNQSASAKLKISVSTPFKGVVLLDPQGEKVESGSVICSNALLGYRCLVMGYENIPVTIQYFKDDQHSHPEAEVITKFYKGANNKLQMLDNEIQTIFRINKKSFLEYKDKGLFYLHLGHNLTIQLDQFNCIANVDESLGQIKIYDKRENPITDFPYELFYIPLNCSPENITINKIPNQDGEFRIIPEEVIRNEIIIFSSSSKTAYLQVRPRYVNLSGTQRAESHDEIINSLRDEMLISSYDSIIWKTTLKYFEAAIDGNIPFETFNHMAALSKDKKLMSRFFIYLTLNLQYDEAKLMAELSRYEVEFGQAWHWINYRVWKEAINDYLNEHEFDAHFQSVVKKQLLKRVIDLLTFHSIEKDSLRELLQSIFLDNSNLNFGYVPQPSNAEIQFEKKKFNNGNGINIPDYISDLYPNIPNQFRDLFQVYVGDLKQWGGVLLSPVFAALAITDHKEVFVKNNYWQLQRVLYYLDLDPEWYFYVFETMIKKIITNN
jgi:hypothetical protein